MEIPYYAATVKFSALITSWRERQRWTQAAAAEYLSKELGAPISLRTLQDWSQGRWEPKGIARSAIVKILNKGMVSPPAYSEN